MPPVEVVPNFATALTPVKDLKVVDKAMQVVHFLVTNTEYGNTELNLL
jgi:hypothetical protein